MLEVLRLRNSLADVYVASYISYAKDSRQW